MAQDGIDDRYRPDPEPGDDDLWPAPPETDAEAARWKSGPDASYPHDPGMNMACEYGDCDHREAPHIAASRSHAPLEADESESGYETSAREVPGVGRRQIDVAMSREVNGDREARFAAESAARQSNREEPLHGRAPDEHAEHERLDEAIVRRSAYVPSRPGRDRAAYREPAELGADVTEAGTQPAWAEREAEP